MAKRNFLLNLRKKNAILFKSAQLGVYCVYGLRILVNLGNYIRFSINTFNNILTDNATIHLEFDIS